MLSKLLIQNGVMDINGGRVSSNNGFTRVSKYLEVAAFKFCPAGQYNLQVFQNVLLLYYYIFILVLLLLIIDIFLRVQELGNKFL